MYGTAERSARKSHRPATTESQKRKVAALERWQEREWEMVSEDAFALCEAVAQRLPGEWSETKTAAPGQGIGMRVATRTSDGW